MNDIKPNDLLAQLRALAAQSGVSAGPDTAINKDGDFGSVMAQSINKVNESKQQANRMAEAFERGDPNVELSQVMIEMQKARVSFEALSQVRNKLVSAYQEIMNMQV